MSVPASAPAITAATVSSSAFFTTACISSACALDVLEQRRDVRVLRVDAALERGLAGRFGDDGEAVAQAEVVHDELGFHGPGRAVVAPRLRRPGVGRGQRMREHLEAEVACAPCRARPGRACPSCSRAGPARPPARWSCRRCWRSRARRGSSGGRRASSRGSHCVERAVEAVASTVVSLTASRLRSRPSRVFAHAQDVRRLAAQAAVLRHEGVRAVHVVDRRDHDDHVVENAPCACRPRGRAPPSARPRRLPARAGGCCRAGTRPVCRTHAPAAGRSRAGWRAPSPARPCAAG